MPASFILRSGNICTLLWFMLLLMRKPYAREIQGMVGTCTLEATRTTYPIAGQVAAWVLEALTKIQVRMSAAASYVGRTCREHYPSAVPEREFVFSSVRINQELVTRPRDIAQFSTRGLRLLSVGRLEFEKGHHVLIDAIARLGPGAREDLTLQIVGDGREFERLQKQVQSLGLEDTVELLGLVEYGPPLFELLDSADLFVLPSLTEGLPRALLEAMARGLPAVGCRAGGIVELLAENQLVPPNDAGALANAIADRLGKPQQLAAESRRNFELATENYGIDIMQQRKIAFWNTVRDTASGMTLRPTA